MTFFRARALRRVLVAAVGASILVTQGCSAFKPKHESVLISTPQPGAQIEVDGRPVGNSPVTVELQRNKSHSIVARQGSRTGTAQIGTKISTTGILDIVGTFLLIVPVIGIFTPGFYDLDQTNVVVPLHQ